MNDDPQHAPQNCVLCGSDLTHAHPDAWCPTCRAPVARSIPGDALEHSEIEHVRTLKNGWLLVLAQIPLAIATLGIVLYLEFTGQLTLAAEQTITVFSLGSMLLLLLGWWWFTQPEERVRGAHDAARIRSWLRTSLLISTALSIPATILDTFLYPGLLNQPSSAPVWATLLHLVLSLLSGLAGLSFVFAGLKYIQWIAPRLRSITAFLYSSRAFKYTLWAIPCGVLTVVFAVLSLIPGLEFFALLTLAPALALLGLMLAVGIYQLVLLVVVWRRLSAIYKAKLDAQLATPTF